MIMAVKIIPLTINTSEQSQIISELEVLHRVSSASANQHLSLYIYNYVPCTCERSVV